MDKRYTIRQEYCGYPDKMYVVRFCGDWVGCRTTRKEAKILCRENIEERQESINNLYKQL